MNFGKYTKSITALIVGVIGWLNAVAAHPGGFSNITSVLWIGLLTVVAVAAGVYTLPNTA